jgi:hypothetical protein
MEREEPSITFEYHGLRTGIGSGNLAFTLSLFENGKVVFMGIERTRVSGEAVGHVAPERVKAWLKKLVDDGALSFKERSNWAPNPDSNWYRLTVVLDGQRNSARWYGWNSSSPTIQVLDEILTEVNRWETSVPR